MRSCQGLPQTLRPCELPQPLTASQVAASPTCGKRPLPQLLLELLRAVCSSCGDTRDVAPTTTTMIRPTCTAGVSSAFFTNSMTVSFCSGSSDSSSAGTAAFSDVALVEGPARKRRKRGLNHSRLKRCASLKRRCLHRRHREGHSDRSQTRLLVSFCPVNVRCRPTIRGSGDLSRAPPLLRCAQISRGPARNWVVFINGRHLEGVVRPSCEEAAGSTQA